MVNKLGVHVGEGVGEDCAASGPAQKKTAIASIRDSIGTVQVCIKPFVSRRNGISDPGCLCQAPGRLGSARVPRAGERVLAIANFQSASCESSSAARTRSVFTIRKLRRWKATPRLTI